MSGECDFCGEMGHVEADHKIDDRVCVLCCRTSDEIRLYDISDDVLGETCLCGDCFADMMERTMKGKKDERANSV